MFQERFRALHVLWEGPFPVAAFHLVGLVACREALVNLLHSDLLRRVSLLDGGTGFSCSSTALMSST